MIQESTKQNIVVVKTSTDDLAIKAGYRARGDKPVSNQVIISGERASGRTLPGGKPINSGMQVTVDEFGQAKELAVQMHAGETREEIAEMLAQSARQNGLMASVYDSQIGETKVSIVELES